MPEEPSCLTCRHLGQDIYGHFCRRYNTGEDLGPDESGCYEPNPQPEVADVQEHDDMNPIWFLLYDGTSADGLGHGNYCGRTTDREEAKAHFLKCWNNPYSIGKVMIVTDDHAWSAMPIDFNLTNKR